MDRRLQLQTTLETLKGTDPAVKINTYFQPPASLIMSYPAIVYDWFGEDVKYASNRAYRRKRRYQVTVITRDPDSDIPDLVAELPLCRYDRSYVADNLNHTVYNLYF